MTHTGPRALFGAAVLLASLTFAGATFAALQPKPVAIAPDRDVAVAKIDALPDRLPQEFVVPQLRGLDVLARHLRLADVPIRPGVPVMGERATRDGDLHVFLVRHDDQVRGFIGLDPRNSCPLGVIAGMFHDICHGSLYDIDGNLRGGPSPWALDELILSVRQGIVYAELHDVTPGRLVRR